MTEQFLTVAEVASVLRVHPITVRRQLRSGVLRGIKTGKLWRVAQSALNVPPAATDAHSADDALSQADALWRDITGGDDQKRGAALKKLAYASDEVSAIVLQRSGEVAAEFYASPEGQAEWEDQADWRALDSEPVFDDEEEDEDASS